MPWSQRSIIWFCVPWISCAYLCTEWKVGCSALFSSGWTALLAVTSGAQQRTLRLSRQKKNTDHLTTVRIRQLCSKMHLKGIATSYYCYKRAQHLWKPDYIPGWTDLLGHWGFLKCLLPQPFPVDATAFCLVDTETLIFLVYHTSSFLYSFLCQNDTNTSMFLLLYDIKYIPARCPFLAVDECMHWPNNPIMTPYLNNSAEQVYFILMFWSPLQQCLTKWCHGQLCYVLKKTDEWKRWYLSFMS